MLGAILRIDVDGTTSTTEYAIPPDNPFINLPGVQPEIFAFGLRNPWRCSFDQGDPQTGEGYGRLFCGDVGQHKVEEIDLIVKGGNYGWRAFEGSRCYDKSMCPALKDQVTPPIYEYSLARRQSVIGGYVYRGCQWPRLQGKYIYGDYESGKLYTLTEEDGRWHSKEICFGSVTTCTNKMTGKMEKKILSFGEDSKGEIYILVTALHSTRPFGKIYHLVDPQRRADPSSCSKFKLFAERMKSEGLPPRHEPSAPTSRRTTNTIMRTTPGLANLVTTALPAVSKACAACRTRHWTSVGEFCQMRYSHYLKVKVITNEAAHDVHQQRRLVLVELLPVIAPRQLSATEGQIRGFIRARNFAFIWVLGPAARCQCPILEVGKTYAVMTYGNKSTIVITMETFVSVWDDDVWPGRLQRLQHFCARS